jgi:TonB family protein
MYFDFEDAHPETPSLMSPISVREGVLLSIIAHLVFVVLILLAPEIPWVRAMLLRQDQATEEARLAELQRQRDQQPRFVFVQPRLEMPKPKLVAPRAEMSDRDRAARAPERAPNPTNMMPFSRGNTSERVDNPQDTQARRQPQEQEQSAAPGSQAQQNAAAANAAPNPNSLTLPRDRQNGNNGTAATGVLGNAVRNIDRYASPEVFQNLGGAGGQYGPFIQFDSKGVDFGWWIRRFVAQIKRNWFVPYAAMSMRGHVVITFFVHKDGRLSELTVVGPSAVESFNSSAYNALVTSNPTYPLPNEYPDERAFFTVTFFYNENPPQN